MTDVPPIRRTNGPRRPVRHRRTGSEDIDRLLTEVVALVGGPDADVVAEMAATVVRLGIDGADRGDLKLVNGALRELRRALQLFAHFSDTPKVSVFGSARTPPGDPNYALAVDFGRAVAREGWMVITGAGGGIMSAANLGAGTGASFGVNIRLPFEQEPNETVAGDRKLLNFRYFFTRKLVFVKMARAFAYFPGGFGTMDEAFEVLTLMQTGRSDLHPVVLLQAPGDGYWDRWVDFLRGELLRTGLVSPEDLDIFTITSDVEEAVAELTGFYRNYHSERYVNGRLYLRVQRLPDAAGLAALNEDFADIVESGRIRAAKPHADEISDDDALHLERIAFDFDRRSFGRLRTLIDRLNEM